MLFQHFLKFLDCLHQQQHQFLEYLVWERNFANIFFANNVYFHVIYNILCEYERYAWFKSTEMINEYMKRRFTSYFCGWYLEKLTHAKPEEVDECKRTLRKIFDLYADVYTDTDSRIAAFLKETDSLK